MEKVCRSYAVEYLRLTHVLKKNNIHCARRFWHEAVKCTDRAQQSHILTKQCCTKTAGLTSNFVSAGTQTLNHGQKRMYFAASSQWLHHKVKGGNYQQPRNILQRELHAFRQLLQRSDNVNISRLFGVPLHQFSTSGVLGQNDPSQRDKDEGDKKKGPENEDFLPIGLTLVMLFALVMVGAMIIMSMSQENPPYYVSWNEFINEMLAKGEVEKVRVAILRENSGIAFIYPHFNAVIKGKRIPYFRQPFQLQLADARGFEDKVRLAEKDMGIRNGDGVPIQYARASGWAEQIIPLIILLGFFLLISRGAKAAGKSINPTEMFGTKAKYLRVDKLGSQGKVSFKDVAGLHEAKIEIKEFVDYLNNPLRYKRLGARIPKGALLLGPPGCGKTLLAKAVASEAGVPFLAMAGSDFVEMIGGLGASRVRDLFKEARQRAPCIIYIDEIDAIGRQRSGGGGQGNEEGEQTLNQLLVDMDGMGSTEGVIMLASTNRPDILDKALLRPGRFDRHILIDLPTLQERHEVFEIYLQKLKTVQPAKQYAQRLAQLSPGMSGADIANICNEAALHAARVKRPAIDTVDFEYAVERIIAGVAKKSTVLSHKERKILAYHEAGHALVGWMLEHTDALLKVSIVPRTSSTLGFAQYTPQDKHLHSKQELFEKMCMALGGRVAESLTFNSVTQGARDDLQRVTKLAYSQVRELGMSDRVGQLSFPPPEGDMVFGSKPYSKKLARIIDEEAKLLIAQAYKATEAILQRNKEKLRVVSEALLEREALSYSEMEELIGPPPYGHKRLISSEWDHPPQQPPPVAAV